MTKKSKYWKINKDDFYARLWTALTLLGLCAICFMMFCTIEFIAGNEGIRYQQGQSDARDEIYNLVLNSSLVNLYNSSGSYITLKEYHECNPYPYLTIGYPDGYFGGMPYTFVGAKQ